MEDTYKLSDLQYLILDCILSKYKDLKDSTLKLPFPVTVEWILERKGFEIDIAGNLEKSLIEDGYCDFIQVTSDKKLLSVTAKGIRFHAQYKMIMEREQDERTIRRGKAIEYKYPYLRVFIKHLSPLIRLFNRPL